MSQKHIRLSESGFSLGKVTGKNRWRARLIKTGPGSSGVYTENALRETGPAAFPVGFKVNSDHQSWREAEEHPAGSIKTLIGAGVTEPVFEEDGLYSEIEFSEEWAPFVEQFAPILGLSINAFGYGNEEDEYGRPIIEGLIPSPLNTVDLVTVAGAGGKLLDLVESYRQTSDKIGSEVSIKPDRKKMTPEEIQALTEALKSAIKEAIPAPVVEEPKEEVKVSDVAEALVEAELPKASRDAVYKAVEGGASLEDAIAAQKELIAQLKESVEDEGRTKDTIPTLESFKVVGWN